MAEISHEEYMRILKEYVSTTGDDEEDSRLAEEAFEKEYNKWLEGDDAYDDMDLEEEL